MDIPARWEYCEQSTYYKVGRFNFVYMWNNAHWQRSAKTENELIHSKDKTKGNRKGNPNGNKPDKSETKQRAILELITELGALSKQDIRLMSGISDNAAKHALKGLTGKGSLVYIKRKKLYSLPVDSQIELFKRLAL